MALRTRLTEAFGLRHPVVLAPMDPASGGALAAAVSAAGGLGLIGGGYGDHDRLQREFAAAGNQHERDDRRVVPLQRADGAAF